MEEFTSVTRALDAVGFGRVQWLLLVYCGLAWLADACEVMLLSFLGPSIRCAWGVSAGAESVLTSVVFCGMLAGVLGLGVTSDYLGRRRGFLLSAVLLGASGLASAFAPTFGWLLMLRAVVGFALGGTPIAVTLFAEFCTSEGRGRWVLLMQSFWTLGTVLEALLAWAVLPTLGWRWLLGLSALPLLGLLALFPLLPESAHWLVSQQRYAEAEAVLQRVATVNGYGRPLLLRLAPSSAARLASDGERHQASTSGGTLGSGRVRSRSPGSYPSKPSPSVQAPLLPAGMAMSPPAAGGRHHSAGEEEQQQRQQQQSRQQPAEPRHSETPAAWRHRVQNLLDTMPAAFGAVFSPHLRRTTLLLYVVWFANAITYYGLVLLTTALQTAAKEVECTPQGGPNLDASDFTAILVTTLAEAPGLLAAAALIDGKGRKWTLRAGLTLCAVALASLVADPPRAGQLAMLFVARACIEGTFSILYVYTPELYPTAVRSFGVALCNGFSRFGGFLAPFTTVYLVESGRSHTAELLLGGLCGGAALCAFLLPYETRGRDLQSSQLQPDGGVGSGGSGSRKEQWDGRRHSSDSGDGHGGSGSGSGSLHSVGVQRASWESEAELVPSHGHEDEGAKLLTASHNP